MRRPWTYHARRAAGILLVVTCAGSIALAQTTAGVSVHEVFAGSEMDSYLRALQAVGIAPSMQWTIRPHSPRELEALLNGAEVAHPWRSRVSRSDREHIAVVMPTLGVRFNSAFPYSVQDGALWAGRGLTAVAQGGVTGRWGALSVTMSPTWFHAANASVTTRRVAGDSALSPFADGVYPRNIDQPQRFGDGSYSRLDPGQSTVRIEAGGVAVGASTANEAWGPARRFGYILSANGAGFPRLFAGTSRAVSIGIGRLHTKFFWGQLQQSQYSPAPDSLRLRYTTGGIIVMQPRGLTGLEVGVARFFHEKWPRGGLRKANLARPFEGVIKVGLPADTGGLAGEANLANQLASVFARWVVHGGEIYAEAGREDHAFDRRDLIVEPDHIASLMVGMARAWQRPRGVLMSLGVEVISYRANRLVRHRSGPATYFHGALFQGHTHLGQVLGADAGVGAGAGFEVSLNRYASKGRETLRLSRTLRYDEGRFHKDGVRRPERIDQIYALSASKLMFSRRGDVSIGTALALSLGRDFERDVANVNGIVSWTPPWLRALR